MSKHACSESHAHTRHAPKGVDSRRVVLGEGRREVGVTQSAAGDGGPQAKQPHGVIIF